MSDRREEYLDRTRRLKPLIEADSSIIDRIRDVIRDTIELGLGRPVSGANYLGNGSSNAAYWVGTVTDPSNGRTLDLALKVGRRNQYSIDDPDNLADELGPFVREYVAENNPPYFVAAVDLRGFQNGLSQEAAILTEDVSCRKTRPIIPTGDGSHFMRTNPDGSVEKFFLDSIEKASPDAQIYLGSDLLIKV